ncbi:hypothetical protein MMC14_010693, partial [Varicellaria rhodocarpa]|nr:hypothetical protein [Varicellaria rhodocarpa]
SFAAGSLSSWSKHSKPTPHLQDDAADPDGPAVSIDGYPRYTPQWGVGLPEKKKVAPPTPIRREPSDRARAVMTRPGTPPYPKAVGGGPKAAGSSSKFAPSGDEAN